MLKQPAITAAKLLFLPGSCGAERACELKLLRPLAAQELHSWELVEQKLPGGLWQPTERWIPVIRANKPACFSSLQRCACPTCVLLKTNCCPASLLKAWGASGKSSLLIPP